MSQDKRAFKIKLEAKGVADKKVSIKLFVKAVQNIQKAVYDLAESKLDKEPSQGRRRATIERDCELFLIKAIEGSLEATVAFPSKSHELLYFNVEDTAEIVMEDFKNAVKSIYNHKPEDFRSIVTNPLWQKKIFKAINSIIPSEREDYELFFQFPDEEIMQTRRIPKNLESAYIDNFNNIIEEKDNIYEINAICRAKIDDESGKAVVCEVIDYELINDTRPYRTNNFIINNKQIFLKYQELCG